MCFLRCVCNNIRYIAYVVVSQVVVEALFTQKPSTTVKVFIIVVSLVLGLMILAALIWCLWKVNTILIKKKKKERINTSDKQISWIR